MQSSILNGSIFRSSEYISNSYELRYLAQKGEIRMKSMNLFGGNDKSSEALFGDNKSKETTKTKKKIHTEDFKKKAVNLASKIGVTKAAEELGVSTSSIYSWQNTLGTSTLAKNNLAKKLPPLSLIHI